MTDNHSIVSPDLTVNSLRSSGYKNTAYAAAELIDNSIQAEANFVELVCLEETIFNRNQVKRISEIAVIDNGCGMNKDLLQRSLKFGDGTHLEEKNQRGIGKFGMGLPSASISQGRRVEVWSWQNGIESAMYSYIDTDEMKTGLLKDVPEPIKKLIPDVYKKNSQAISSSKSYLVPTSLKFLASCLSLVTPNNSSSAGGKSISIPHHRCNRSSEPCQIPKLSNSLPALRTDTPLFFLQCIPLGVPPIFRVPPFSRISFDATDILIST